MPRVRAHLRAYTRDTYLGKSMVLNPDYTPIDCAVGCSQWGTSSAAFAAHAMFDVSDAVAYSETFHRERFIPSILERFQLSPISPKQVFLGHGSFNIAERIAHKLIAPGNLLGVGPQFVEIPSEFVAAGFLYQPVHLRRENHYEFPLAELIAELRTRRYTAFYLDNPNNPLGYHVPQEVIVALVKEAEKVGCIMLIDEAFGDFLPDLHSSAILCAGYNNVIVTRSLSKVHGLGGLRVGYTIMSEELAQYYQQLDVPFEPTTHAVTIGDAVMRDSLFIEGVRQTVSSVKGRVVQACRNVGITVLPTHPATSIMTIARYGGNICEEMANIGVMIENGTYFLSSNPNWTDEYCRLRIPASDLLDEFEARVSTLS